MLWFIFCQSEILLSKNAESKYSIPDAEEPPIEINPLTVIHKITPMSDGTEVRTFAIDNPIIGYDNLEMCSLRQAFHKISLPLYLKAGKCQEILYWDNTTKFCGVCGGKMQMHTDISKRCTQCGKEVWPHLATAVITLIQKGEEVLLVKARNFKGDYFGLVAGFVETGENLEEAAAREIKEEVGVKVKNMRYVMSQPWPYPSGLMIGFIADYDSGEITLQTSELTTGGWFHKENLPQLPDKLGIARMMVEMWKEGKI